jgi:hypothetical protein
MTEPAMLRKQPWILGTAALGLIAVGWILFVLSFTARAAAWWNSLHVFFAIYLASFALALGGIRSGLGILALILSALSLCLISFLLFG